MDGRRFFLEAGFDGRGFDHLTEFVYDLAWFWRVDPELMMQRPLDVLCEAMSQAQRINAARVPE